MSKLLWYLFIKSLDQKKDEHIKLFDTLFNVCKNSRYACLKISKEVYSEYLNYINKPMFIWRKSLDGWGGFYKGKWCITEWKPSKEDIDPLGNSNILFKGSINKVLKIANKNINI